MMKNNLLKIILNIIIILIITLNFYASTSRKKNIFAESEYAKITTSGVAFYSLPDMSDNENIICYIEKTYFVEILLEYDAVFYKANYSNIIGFVKKSQVSRVSGVPQKPFPDDTLILIKDQVCNLRLRPTISDNIITQIPAKSSKIKYIGKIYGVRAIDYGNDIWYYVEYDGQKGYIYDFYVSQITAIYDNIENLVPLTHISENMLNPLSNPICLVIIGVILCPTLIILYIMFKKPSKAKF